MIEFLPIVFIVSFFWFPIYWIVGGVIFAIIAFSRSMKLRRVRFSTYFTILSFLMAFGASYGGMQFAYNSGNACAEGQIGFINTISAVIGCGILEFATAGFFGFISLLVLGSFLMVLSRATNQSWVDSDMGLDEVTEITFENM